MISLTRLNGHPFIINTDLIETIESTPDTVIALATGNRYVVKESVDLVMEKAIAYKKKVNCEKPVPNPIQGFNR